VGQPYPHLRELYAAYRDVEVRTGRKDGFGHGLGCILDGLQALVPARGTESG
jgi:hypothetical protein